MHPLAPYGWSDRVAAMAAGAAPAQPARAVRVDRSRIMVAVAAGLVAVPAPLGSSVTTGDWLAVADGHIAEVLPRWSSLTRRGADGRAQDLAANIDIVMVVAPLDRPPNPNRLERELVLAGDAGAVPVVVLTKSDGGAAERPRLVGVDVVETSAVTGAGVDDLRERLRPDRTAVLIGPSGAGKSALVNALLATDRLETGEVRGRDHKGRHTTTARYLLPVPGGGVLIDTPGLRAVGLGDAVSGLAQAFPDIEDLAARCRFSDCRHAGEPECAVVDSLDPLRLASWQKLQREVAAEARRSDPTARATARRQSKAVERSMRRFYFDVDKGR